MTSKPGIPSPVIDVELLNTAIRNIYERRYGAIESDLPVVVFGEMADGIAAEYTRLASEPSIPVEEGERPDAC